MTASELAQSGLVIGHEGPTLINFRRDCARFELEVNRPGLLFTSLEVRTTLGLQDGCDYAALRKFVDGFVVTAFCGHSRPELVGIRVAMRTLAPYVSIDVGLPSMYMSVLQFDTKKEETFGQLCNRTLNPLSREEYLVALVPILNVEVEHAASHSIDKRFPHGADPSDINSDAEAHT